MPTFRIKKLVTHKVFIFFVLALMVAGGFVALFYWRQVTYSSQALSLEVSGPESATMGSQITYTVSYKNTGNFVMEKPNLVFQLPDNSLTEDGKTRFNQALNDIYPGGEDFVKFRGRLLGKEGDLKAARAF